MTTHYVGVDLGGTSIKTAIANSSGEILIREPIPTASHAGPEQVLKNIVAHVRKLQSKLPGESSSIAGLGMGVPGLVDIENGITKFLPNFPTKWKDIPAAQIIGDELGCTVHLLNDVRTATLGELRFGHGKDRPNLSMAFFAIGTGIGGGVVIDGKLRLGPLGSAGELGHQTILFDGPRCGCGNRGCLEVLASGPAIAAEGVRLMLMGHASTLFELVDGNANRVTTREMATAAQHDESVKEAIVNAATYIGVAAANIVTAIHPDMIVLGGGVAEIGDLFINRVREVISTRVGMFPTDTIEVKRSQLGDQAGLMGAIALAQK